MPKYDIVHTILLDITTVEALSKRKKLLENRLEYVKYFVGLFESCLRQIIEAEETLV